MEYDAPLETSHQEEHFALSYASIREKLVELFKKGDKLVHVGFVVRNTE